MQLLLGPILGHTTDSSARLWIHTDQASNTPIECHVYRDTARTTPIAGSPFSLVVTQENNFTAAIDITLPDADHTYYYNLTYQNAALGNEYYTFRNQPSDPEQLVFAVTSCHRPFKYSGDRRMAMWQRLHDTLLSRNGQFVLQVGDQIYADNGKSFWHTSAWDEAKSLCEDDEEEGVSSNHSEQIQKIYRNAYQMYWGFNEHRELMARFPQYMIWDDHDITNGWGSDITHKEDCSRQVFDGASEVYRCFQHAHNPANPLNPDAYYYGFHLGDASFMTLDLRGHRHSWDNQLLGAEQKVWIEHFIGECNNSKVLFVISSVPMFHLKRRFANIPFLRRKSDIGDQWSHEANAGDRRWLLDKLITWLGADNERRVIILGGDVHVGTFADVRLKENNDIQMVQATSSPIANKPAGLLDRFVKAVSDEFETELEPGKTLDVKIKDRFWERNFLIVTVDTSNSKPEIKLELFEEGKEHPAVKQVN